LCDEVTTGDEVTVDLDKDVLINHRYRALPPSLPPSRPPSLPPALLAPARNKSAGPVIHSPTPSSLPPSLPLSTGKEYKLQALGDAGPVIEAGGIFPYAVKTGMIEKAGV